MVSRAAERPRSVEAEQHIWTRRDFFSLSGWLGVLAVFFAWTVSMVRFMFPRVLFEPSPLFKAGFPEEYSVGEVSERFKASQGVWIVREEKRFYALVARCTHLGCTPRWLAAEDKFKCPCHGSGFTKGGVNFEGPAPRPLERVRVTLDDDGQLLIDKSKTFLWERGEWDEPGSFLEV